MDLESIVRLVGAAIACIPLAGLLLMTILLAVFGKPSKGRWENELSK